MRTPYAGGEGGSMANVADVITRRKKRGMDFMIKQSPRCICGDGRLGCPSSEARLISPATASETPPCPANEHSGNVSRLLHLHDANAFRLGRGRGSRLVVDEPFACEASTVFIEAGSRDGNISAIAESLLPKVSILDAGIKTVLDLAKSFLSEQLDGAYC